jgi:hypothetical protein
MRISSELPILLVIVITSMALNSCYKVDTIPQLSDSGTLPVFKIYINEKYLWSPDSGLYIIGVDSELGDLNSSNFYEKWEFPARVEYYENSNLEFTSNVGFRIKGKGSRKKPMKSIGLYWRSKYGENRLDYPMFPYIEVNRFKRLHLRNAGNDFGKTHIKDASIATIHRLYSNVEYQEYKPCALYLNDSYWGIHNIREMITPRHFQYHYGVNPDMVDLLEGSELYPIADDGTIDDYMNDIIGFLESNDLSIRANYEEFTKRIDLLSYIDYIIIQTYLCNTDWPTRNTKWWREKNSSNFNKWRWVVYDLDLSMQLRFVDRVYIGDLYRERYDDDRRDGFFIFNNLIKNEEFIQVFLDRYKFFIEVVFEEKRVEQIIRANQRTIEKEYPIHASKWQLISLNRWKKEIDDMLEFNRIRNKKMIQIINNLTHD